MAIDIQRGNTANIIMGILQLSTLRDGLFYLQLCIKFTVLKYYVNTLGGLKIKTSLKQHTFVD